MANREERNVPVPSQTSHTSNTSYTSQPAGEVSSMDELTLARRAAIGRYGGGGVYYALQRLLLAGSSHAARPRPGATLWAGDDLADAGLGSGRNGAKC